MISQIGIVYPKAQRHMLAITSVQLSFRESFPQAKLRHLEQADLESGGGLNGIDLLVLPPSHGDITPYEFILKGKAAENVAAFAEEHAVAAFCSGAYALTDRFSYRYTDGNRRDYRGYIPLFDLPAQGPEDFDFVMKDGGSRFADVRLLDVFSKVAVTPTRTPLCYANGPSFDIAAAEGHPDYRVLATYKGGNAAILGRKTRSGLALAFGALPEIQASHVPEKYADWLTIMRGVMLQAEPMRRDIWNECMEMLAKRSLYPRQRAEPTIDFIAP